MAQVVGCRVEGVGFTVVIIESALQTAAYQKQRGSGSGLKVEGSGCRV